MAPSSFYCPDYHGEEKGKLIKIELQHIGAVGKRRLYACPRDGHVFVNPSSCNSNVMQKEKKP